MGLGLRFLAVLIVVVIAAVTSLLVYLHMSTPSHVIKVAIDSSIVPDFFRYGALGCQDYYVVIPGNSVVVLYYHVHGSVSVNTAWIQVAFPASIVREVLSELPSLPNQSGVIMVGVYVDGKLIAFHEDSSVIKEIVRDLAITNGTSIINSTSNTPILYIPYEVDFPAINLTSNDTIALVIYSTVTYTLPSCKVASEGEEVRLMVKNGWIGMAVSSASPTAEQLYEGGEYITEKPVIYLVGVQGFMSQLPQELPTNVRTFITGYAPTFAIGGTPSTSNG